MGIAGLTGFGITAFGIAPLAPDAAEVPQRWVTQDVALDGLGSQIDALAAHPMALWRSDLVRGALSAESLLRRMGAQDADAARFLRSDARARRLLQSKSAALLQARLNVDGSLQELVARMPADRAELARTHFIRLTVMRVGGRLQSTTETVELTATTRLASGTIRTSVWAAADEARLPDAVATQLAEIFSGEIDFQRGAHRGDTFSIAYETLLADGQPVPWNEGAGRVLAAEFVNRGRAHHALWFSGSGKSGYFGLDGSSKQKLFLTSPLEFSRVTSGFAARFNPVLQSWRQHLGVDYGAPIGTAVRTVGEGVVVFAGWQNGYGKVVEVQHGGETQTLYAHLSAIDVKKGDRVAQGQHIGAVGNTGWSTGPHLHFEFRVRGQHQDPLQIAGAAESVTLDTAARARFTEVAQALQAKLDIAETLTGPPSRTE